MNKETIENGWAEISVPLPDSEGRPLAVEIAMEPVTPPTKRQGPPALSITVPMLASR